MNANIGIDIGKKKCDYCVVNGRGRVLDRGQYPNTPKDTREFAEKMARKYTRCRAACETTANMWNITYDACESAGIKILLANTYKMAIISKTAKKTDKVDAEKIAQILRMDMIPECFVPPREIRGIRAMIRQRTRTVWDRTRVINRVHSLLDRHGLEIDASSMYAKKAIEQLESAKIEPIQDQLVLDQYASQIKYLTEQVEIMDNLLASEAARNEDAKLIASMTGMGIYHSLLLAVEIADIGRFASPKKLVSWAGLCPAVYQSGETTYAGKIKKLDTASLVNWAMCEAANTAVRYDDRMKVVYESARIRHADKHALAIIVVANKMITIVWHMLMTRTPYKSHNENLYKRKLAKMEKARR